MKHYKEVEKMLRQDFEEAKIRRNFSEMTDYCEMLMELWATGELDADEYHKHAFLPMAYCFAEVKGNKIKLPSEYKTCCKNFGKKAIYSLEKDSIKLILNNVDDEKIFDYFNEEGIETRYIILGNYIELDILANNTLGLHNGDIVELCIDDEMIEILNLKNVQIKNKII